MAEDGDDEDSNSQDEMDDIERGIDEFFPAYEPTESIRIGLKIFETIDDKFLFPLSVKVLDTPGTIKNRPGQIQFAFEKPSLIFLIFDYSKLLNPK